jgi:hypothetical protein
VLLTLWLHKPSGLGLTISNVSAAISLVSRGAACTFVLFVVQLRRVLM